MEETPGTAADARNAEDPVLEYKVREMTFLDRVNRELAEGLRGADGRVGHPGSWAQVAEPARRATSSWKINDETVSTIRGFKKLVKKLGKEKPKRVKLFVRRGRSTAFVFMRPEWPRD